MRTSAGDFLTRCVRNIFVSISPPSRMYFSKSLLLLLLIIIETTKYVASDERSSTTSCDSNLVVDHAAIALAEDLPRLKGTRTGNDAIRNEATCLLQKYGAVIIEDLVSVEGMDKLAGDLDQDTSGTFFGAPGSFAGSQTTRNAAKPLGESRIAQALAMHPIITAIVRIVLSPYTKRIVLGTCSAINVVGPQSSTEAPAPAQEYHRDDSMWAGDWITNLACRNSSNNDAFPMLSVSVMWAASDFTDDNGATQLALGSHRQCPRTAQAPVDMKFTKAIMKKGSAVLWLGGTLHGASSPSPLLQAADAPRLPRRGLLNIYNLGYLRPEHNFFNAIPPTVIAKFDEPLRDLLGYHGDNPVEHPWYTGPVYSQPYLGSPKQGGNAAGGVGVQYAVEPESVWEVTAQGDAAASVLL